MKLIIGPDKIHVSGLYVFVPDRSQSGRPLDVYCRLVRDDDDDVDEEGTTEPVLPRHPKTETLEVTDNTQPEPGKSSPVQLQ
jgi:hypothetical protein